MHKGDYSPDRVTRKVPVSKGERPLRYNDSTPINNPGFGVVMGPEGVTSCPGYKQRATGPALDRGIPRGIPNRDRFNQAFSTVGSGVVGGAKRSPRFEGQPRGGKRGVTG